jgi:tetratricopeptide (TPR) repeat protein
MGSVTRIIVLLAVVVRCASALANPSAAFEDALARARGSGGLLLAAIVDTESSHAVLTALRDPALSKELCGHHRVVLNAADAPLLAARLGAEELPLVVVLDCHGREIGRAVGLRSPGGLLQALRSLAGVANRVVACRRRLERDPADAEAWYLLGDYHWRRGERCRAVGCFQKILRLASEGAERSARHRRDLVSSAREKVAQWLISGNRLAEAASLLRAVPLDLVPERHACWAVLQHALILHRQGRTLEAAELLRRNSARWEKSPAAPRLRFTLGYLLDACGQRQAAREHFASLEKRFPDTVYGHRARRYLARYRLLAHNG